MDHRTECSAPKERAEGPVPELAGCIPLGSQVWASVSCNILTVGVGTVQVEVEEAEAAVVLVEGIGVGGMALELVRMRWMGAEVECMGVGCELVGEAWE